jgi:hypothetical protein
MPVMGQAVGERRPVVEHVFLGAVAAGDAGPEGVVGGPVIEDLGFGRREVGGTGGRLRIAAFAHVSVVSHGAPGSGTTPRRLREHRGTTPLAALPARPLNKAVTGLPVRFY